MRFLLVLHLCLFWTYTNSIFAAEFATTDTSKARLLEEKGRAFYDSVQYDSSFICYNKAIKIYEQNEAWSDWYSVVSKNSKALTKQGQYERSSDYLQSKLKDYFQQAAKPDVIAAKMYARIGIAFDKAGKTTQALEAYRTSLQIFERLNESSSIAASVYKNTANIYTRLTDYDNALLYFQKAIGIQTQLKNHQKLYHLYCDLSNVYYYTNQSEKELQCYQLAAQLPNISAENQGILDQLTSSYYQTQGKLPKALQYAKSAVQKLEGSQYLAYKADAYVHLGNLYQAQGNWREAQQYLENAKQTAYQEYGQFHRETVKFHIGLAELYMAQNDLQAALEEYQKGLTALFPTLAESQNPMLNPPIESLYAEPWIMTILQYKGDLLRKIYQENKDNNALQSALGAYELSLIAQRILLYDYGSQNSKLYAKEKWHTYYENALQTSLQLWKTTQEYAYLERAFEWAEKSKANLLIEQLQTSNAHYLDTLNIPASYLERVANLQKQAYVFEEKKMNLKDSNLTAIYQDSLQNVRLQKGFLEDSLRQLYPNYQERTNDFNEFTLFELQGKIAPEQLFLEYFVGDSSIYVFGVSASQVLLEEVPKTAALNQTLEELVLFLKQQHFNESNYQRFVQNAHLIYKTLVKPILERCEFQAINPPKLTIVPDGILHYIPLETLLIFPVESTNINFYPDALEYLLKHYEISYTQSATLWLQSLERNSTKEKLNDLLAFAPVFEKSDSTLSTAVAAMRSCGEESLNQLSKSEWEVEQIRQIIGGDVYLREQATKSHFLQFARQYHLLHLATHACVSELGHDFNRIYFADDEALSTYDLYGLDLRNTQLVTLSACNTGMGKMVNGEGLMSLARGFFAAGCPSTLMSLWSVPDESTAEMMTYFYAHLHEGHSKSHALQLAKLQYLEANEDEKLYPLHWSAFVLMGNEEAVFEATHWSQQWWVIGGILSVLLLVVFFVPKLFSK